MLKSTGLLEGQIEEVGTILFLLITSTNEPMSHKVLQDKEIDREGQLLSQTSRQEEESHLPCENT